MPLLDFGPVAIQLATPSLCDAWAEPPEDISRYSPLVSLAVARVRRRGAANPFTLHVSAIGARFCADPVQRTAWVYVVKNKLM